MRKVLKVRLLTLIFLSLTAVAFVTWLYQSGKPSAKVYSADGQYSYHLEEYNYNIILRKLTPSFFHETEYKVFLWDEVTGKKLYSGYAGGKTLLRDYFGFQEEDQFHLTKPDYYKLPRPIDRKAIERQERAARDSIRWQGEKEQAKKEFYKLPLIAPEEVEYIASTISAWVAYFSVDLAQARLAQVRTACFSCTPDKADPYYWAFTPKDDSPSLVQMSYSPNKQRYVDMRIAIETINGKHYDTGAYDVDQAVYLVDRQQRHKNILFFNGPSTRVADVFWKSNNVFITVGDAIMYKDLNKFLIHIFDISQQTIKKYELLTDRHPYVDFGSYHNDKYLKEREIIPYTP